MKYGFYEKGAPHVPLAIEMYLAMHDITKTETVSNCVNECVTDLNESETRKMMNKPMLRNLKNQQRNNWMLINWKHQ